MNTDSEFKEMLSITNSLLNEVSRHVRSEIVAGKIVDIFAQGQEQYVTMDYSTEESGGLTRAKYRDTVKFILDKYPIKEKKKRS